MKLNQNPLLMTDVYKISHSLFYKEGTSKVYSYLCARSDKKHSQSLFFGLQPYLKILEKGITRSDAEEFFEYYEMILGSKPPATLITKINNLVELGYIPLVIKAIPEGTVIDNKNVLATVTNSVEGFGWCVGLFESLLLKVWAPTSVATLSYEFKRLTTKFTKETSTQDFLNPFLVHCFGYRGVSSEETAQICGAGHLVNFLGSDTVPAIKFLKENYGGTGLIGASVGASEHSIACSFGPSEQEELEYVNNMIDNVPTGIVSVVSDAYDYWRMLTVTLPKVKDRILGRDGKYVVRPDSGDPKKILCGTARVFDCIEQALDTLYSEKYRYYGMMGGLDNDVILIDNKYYKTVETSTSNGFSLLNTNHCLGLEEVVPTPEMKGTFRILEEIFGATVNSKGYKELNPKIGVIYGDGMYFGRYKDILETMKEMGYANTNLVIGIGGLLLQQHNRDDLGFAFKATYAEINGKGVELFKDPITDPGKKSHKGMMKLVLKDGKYVTLDQQADDNGGELVTVFKNGKVVKEYTLDEIRKRSESFV